MRQVCSRYARAGAVAVSPAMPGARLAPAPGSRGRSLPALACLLAMASCATQPAPGFSGKWQPVNHYPDTTQAIALQRGYVFQAMPMDRTLRAMLARWAAETGRSLRYAPSNDYTLHAAVAALRTSDPEQAAASLDGAFSTQRLVFVFTGTQIDVRVIDAAVADAGAGR